VGDVFVAGEEGGGGRDGGEEGSGLGVRGDKAGVEGGDGDGEGEGEGVGVVRFAMTSGVVGTTSSGEDEGESWSAVGCGSTAPGGSLPPISMCISISISTLSASAPPLSNPRLDALAIPTVARNVGERMLGENSEDAGREEGEDEDRGLVHCVWRSGDGASSSAAGRDFAGAGVSGFGFG